MDLEMVARAIQWIIAPAVMITSCCILAAGLLGHYSSVGERLRMMVRERVDLLKEAEASAPSDLIVRERLEDIDYQIPSLLRQHLLIRGSLTGTLIAMVFYILDMFVIAFSVVADRSGLYGAILVVFMLGVGGQLVGVIYAILDALLSHMISASESRHALAPEKSTVEHTKV